MNREMLFTILAILILLFIVLFFFFLLFVLKNRLEQRREEKEESRKLTVSDIDSDIVNRKKALSDIISPSGIDPNPLSYCVINDAGRGVFVRGFTIDSLPKKTKFATTFRPLMKFPDMRTIIFVTPETEDRTTKKLDHHITILDGEQSTAMKNRDRNRVRSLQGQLNDTEAWVSRIEEGYEKFFRVQFLFILEKNSLRELDLASDAFYRDARKQSIDISACYACHAEAFLSGAPYGEPCGVNLLPFGMPEKLSALRMEYKAPLKTHALSRGAVADIFNHISSDFRHKDGVPLGRTLRDMKVVFFDPYSETHHNGYGIIFSGKTGSGKTTAIKSLAKRLHNTTKGNTTSQYRFAIIDSQKRGNRGEYSSLADDLNGVCNQLVNNSDFIINFCEVSDQLEYDEVTQTEYRALHLSERKTDIVNNLMTIIQAAKDDPDFELGTYIKRILQDIVDECFEELGIFDGKPESLYTHRNAIGNDGALIQKRVKKPLPTITMIYKKAMLRNESNNISEHTTAYRIILDSLKDYVRLIAYCTTPSGIRLLDERMFDTVAREGKDMKYTLDNELYPVEFIRGNKNYFDGQSTFEFSAECACTNFDISLQPESERKVSRQIIMSFITEEFSKNNSMNFNSESSDKLVIIMDEAQENYKYPFMRQSIDTAYRTNRKRNVSMWISEQALSDGSKYEEILQGVVHNTAMMFLFKQPEGDKKFLAEHTVLNEEQIKLVTSIGAPKNLSQDPDEAKEELERHIGECCLIDGQQACFFKFDVLKVSETQLIASNKRTLDEIFRSQHQENGQDIA